MSRIGKLHRASENFLKTVVLQNMSVGLVTFSNDAKTLMGLTEITSERDRQKLVDKLPVNADGGTAIGLGLLQGVKVYSTAHPHTHICVYYIYTYILI